MDLDALLDASAPPIAPRDPALRDELLALVDAAEASVRPRRRRRRAVIVGGVVAAVLAGTAATTAAVAPRAWTSWLSGEGQGTCRMQIDVAPSGPDYGSGGPNMWPDPFPYARRERIVADAQAFTNNFDYAGIDRDAAIRAWQADEEKTIAREKGENAESEKPGEPLDPPQSKLTGDSLTAVAITTWVLHKLDEHLASEGYDMSHKKGADRFLLMDSTGTSCK